MWLLADLEVSFQQSLDIFIGSILSQSCLEILQLVQKSIQTLAKLETQNKNNISHVFFYVAYILLRAVRDLYLAGLD